jgi:hypothetical protein
MSNFKIKHDKTSGDTHVNTLDESHTQLMKSFEVKKNGLPSKKSELNSYKQKLTLYENPRLLGDISEIENLPKLKSELKTKIKLLENEIYDIENDESEFDYYYKTNNTIMDYYDLLNEDDIKECGDFKHGDCGVNDINSNNNKPMDFLDRLNMLNKENNKKKKKVTKRKNKIVANDSSISILNYFIEDNNNGADKKEEIKVEENPKVSRAELLDMYKTLTDSKYICSKNKEKTKLMICNKCSIEKILVTAESIYVCPICAAVDYVIIDCDKTTNKESASENKAGYPYKKINHLNEWLSQFQAKESINIPKEVYDNIIAELNKNKIYDYSELSLSFMKSNILKVLGYEIYYEHTVYIVSNLSGIQPPTINKETEEKIRLMFRQIQIPFNKYRPKNRVNFLSYSYTLHKIFQLLELDDLLKYFPLLKSREKLMLQDELWRKICHDLNWEFYASI